MQSTTEKGISQSWRVQIVPTRYQINNNYQTYDYTCLQKINAHSVNLLNLSMLCAFPNVTNQYKFFTVRVAGVNYQIILPTSVQNNFWNIFSLCNILTTQCNAQTPYTWSFVTAGNQNAFIQITCSQPFNLVANSSNYILQIQRYLGFGDVTQEIYVDPAQTVWQSSFPFNVQVTNQVAVQIRGIGELNSDSVAVLVSIPIVPVDTYIHFESPFYQYARKVIDYKLPYPIQKISISLLDDNLIPLYIQENRISMTLLFEQFVKE